MVTCLANTAGIEKFNYKSTACETIFDKGMLLFYHGKFAEAESYFQESLHYTLQRQEIIWTRLAITSMNLSNLIEAENQIQKALQINNSHPNTLYTAGVVYEMLRDRSRAIVFYEKFLDGSHPQMKEQQIDAEIRLKKLKGSFYF